MTVSTPGASTPLSGRIALYSGVVIYLFGQAYDTYWHAKHVSFVPEPPSGLWRIHLGIWLGAVIVVAVGGWLTARPGLRVTGLLLLAGGLVQLLGFGWDMYLHGQGRSQDLWHNMIWYGFGVVVLGVARFAALTRPAAALPRPAPRP